MADIVLDRARWPPMPGMHRAFLEAAIPHVQTDERLVGLAAGGSLITGVLDEYSDLDLVVVTRPDTFAEVLREGPALARRLGVLLAAFTGEHVGEPRLLVCLYGPPLLHVDLKFVARDDLAHRVEEPMVIWDRDGQVSASLARGRAAYPQPDLQWIEDRFWVWVHYLVVKIARGELFETLDGLAYVRSHVLGPLILREAGVQPNGVRRVETSAPAAVSALRATIGAHDRSACTEALRATVALYAELRERLGSPTLRRRGDVERAARAFLDEQLC